MNFIAVLVVLAAAPAFNEGRFINADALKAQIGFLADDALEGRGPATRGDLLAQRYLAAQFQAMGLVPVPGGSGWYQPVDLVGVTGHPQTVLATPAGGKATSFKFSEEFI